MCEAAIIVDDLLQFGGYPITPHPIKTVQRNKLGNFVDRVRGTSASFFPEDHQMIKMTTCPHGLLKRRERADPKLLLKGIIRTRTKFALSSVGRSKLLISNQT